MTQKQKVLYTQMALSMAGITANEPVCELMIGIYEELKIKAGDFTLRDAAKIKAKVEEKYKRLDKRKKT